MSHQARLLPLLAACLVSACGGGGGGSGTEPTASFVHSVRAENRMGHITLLDHAISNGNPDAFVLVTTCYVAAPGGFGVYDDHNVGVRYSPAHGQWAIAHLDASEMPLGAAFCVTVSDAASAGATTFVLHRTAMTTLDPTSLVIDHPAVNGAPDAILFVTYDGTPGGEPGGGNDHPIGLRYDAGLGRWAVFNRGDSPVGIAYSRCFGVECRSNWQIVNQDMADMIVNVNWNVAVAQP